MRHGLMTVAFCLLAMPCLLAAPAGAEVSAARRELDMALLTLRAHHINRDKVDWASLTAEAENTLDGTDAADAYPVIRLVIAALGTRHSFLMDADTVAARGSGQKVGAAVPPVLRLPEGRRIGAAIGLVQLPAMADPRAPSIKAYEAAAREVLAQFAAAHVCRVIVDLRGNTGGNMYPMLSGLAPLLGPEPYGTFIGNDGLSSAWQVAAVMRGKSTDLDHGAPPAWQARGPVAVLIDRHTASSGEFTALAFAGRAGTRFFGEASAGFLTANSTFALPDGAGLVVTVSYAGNAKGVRHDTVVKPDQVTAAARTEAAAVAWLRRQRCDTK